MLLQEKLHLLPATNIIVPDLWQVLSVHQCLFLLLKMRARQFLLMLFKMSGLGKVLRYGAYGEEVINRLKWMEKVLYPVLKRAIEYSGKINIQGLIAQALNMGDEVHNRNRAGTFMSYQTNSSCYYKQ